MNGESSVETYTVSRVKWIASGNLLYDLENSNQGAMTTERGWMRWEVGGRF